MYERSDHTMLMEPFFPRPFAQYTTPVVTAPEGTVDDWAFFLSLAFACNQPVKFAGRMLDPIRPPREAELLAMVAGRGRLSLSEVMSAGRGVLGRTERFRGRAGHFGRSPSPCAPGPRRRVNRTEFSAAYRVADPRLPVSLDGAAYPGGNELLRHRRAGSRSRRTNPLYVNQEDMRDHAIAEEESVRVRSEWGSLRAVARADRSVPRGVVSMTHGFDNPGHDDGSPMGGSNVDLLTSTRAPVQDINAMPTLTDLPVGIERDESDGSR